MGKGGVKHLRSVLAGVHLQALQQQLTSPGLHEGGHLVLRLHEARGGGVRGAALQQAVLQRHADVAHVRVGSKLGLTGLKLRNGGRLHDGRRVLCVAAQAGNDGEEGIAQARQALNDLHVLLGKRKGPAQSQRRSPPPPAP